VQISVRAIGLNFADVFAIWGLYGATPKEEFTPGLEYAGIVERVGNAVEHLRAGDRAMGVTRFGAYTSHLNIDARYALPLPADWDFATGAAYPVQTLTAYYGMVHLGALQCGYNVLIHSAVGGVGLQALKIARAYDCFCIGTVGSESKVAFAQKEGYDRVIVRGADFQQQLQNALGERPLELVMDSVGGRFFTIPYEMLAPMGRVVVFGSARYAQPADRPSKVHLLRHWLTRPKIDPQKMPETNRGVLGFNLIWLYERAELMHRLLQELDALRLAPPHVGHRFDFEQLPDAVRLFQTGKTIGKVVVEVAG
jgi:alcohol dehydrogenase